MSAGGVVVVLIAAILGAGRAFGSNLLMSRRLVEMVMAKREDEIQRQCDKRKACAKP